jgi:hypothetical protein
MPGIEIFFISIVCLLLIITLEIIFVCQYKYKKLYLVLTILLFFSIIPVMDIGKNLGPTFGKKIEYNNFLWSQSINETIKYYMADDIVKIITENNYSNNEVLLMLGKPTLGDINENYFTYILKNNNLLFGLDIYILDIQFIDGKVSEANIFRMD